ncbi:MAG: PaaI family thioesterase [Paludibacteraceae bacterium]|nr:PaaI family thioesterase [Paludibacteraceae bacterium]
MYLHIFYRTSMALKKIINPWYNYPGYNCFGCSPDNPIGLHLSFYEDGDYIVSTWHPSKNYQGWIDTMHGGILSTLIDEVCGWVVTRKMQASGYTVQLNVKFRKAVPTNEPELTIRANVDKQVRNLVYLHAEITNSKGELCNEGEVVYFLMNEEKSKEMGFLQCKVEGE